MEKAWKKVLTRVFGILLSVAVMAGCMGADTAFAVEREYTVQSGDTLKKIAQKQYGNGDWWEILAQLNKDKLKDPDVIVIGWDLQLSTASNTVVEQSECSVSKLVKYLYANNVEQDSVRDFLLHGTWPDGLPVPARDSVLAEDGAIDWNQAPQGGYELDAQNQAVREKCDLQVGEVLDRYGSANGRYTSPVKNDQPYSYAQRSLPYVEDTSSYHKYEVVGDISQLEKYVNACSDSGLISAIRVTANNYYNGDISQMQVWKGTAAAAYGNVGGAEQYEFPLSIETLCKLGILQEIY